MLGVRHTVVFGLLTAWMQRCICIPLIEGSGTLASLKSETLQLTSQTWAYLADQEASGDLEASQFSSSSGRVSPTSVQMSSLEPSVEEGLSSSIFIDQGLNIGTGDSDIVFDDSHLETLESIPVDTTAEDNDIYELDREGTEETQLVSAGWESESPERPESDGASGTSVGDNEVGDVMPTDTDSATSYPEEGNAILNNVHHSPPDATDNFRNNLNIVLPEHGNEVGGHSGQVKSIDKDDEANNDLRKDGGTPGNGIIAVVMFVGAVGAGALISFLLVNLTRLGKKIYRMRHDS